MGPDGSGKTSVATRVVAQTSGLFRSRELLRESFRVLPALEPLVEFCESRFPQLARKPGAQAGMPEPLPAWQSMLIVSYQALDTIAGALLFRCRPRQSRLVVFDRSFYDYAFVRGHAKLPRLYLKCLTAVVPRPDLAFYLHRDADAIRREKAELSADEIRRQQAVIQHLLRGEACGVTIDAEGGVERTVERVNACIEAHLAGRPRSRRAAQAATEPRS
jgi:thymidylate kinase